MIKPRSLAFVLQCWPTLLTVGTVVVWLADDVVRRRRGRRHLTRLGVWRVRRHHGRPAAGRRGGAAGQDTLTALGHGAAGQDAAPVAAGPGLHELLVLGPTVLEPDLHLQCNGEREES